MAHDPGPCSAQFEDWEDEYEDWQDADAAANKGFKNSMVITGVGLTVCAGAWWTGVGLLGCVVAGAGALNSDYDSIDASIARNEAYEDLQKAKKAYKDCVANHKEYYKQD
jgi:hypothetical protein